MHKLRVKEHTAPHLDAPPLALIHAYPQTGDLSIHIHVHTAILWVVYIVHICTVFGHLRVHFIDGGNEL